jgi:hypothetical protein
VISTERWAVVAHRTPSAKEGSMLTQLTNIYRGGTPKLNAIRQQVPEHGDGRLTYQSTLGDLFIFYFKRTSAQGYDILIEQQRDYGGRDSGSQATHRLGLDRNRPRICIQPGSQPRDLPVAIMISMLWAERTSRYIRDGLPWS